VTLPLLLQLLLPQGLQSDSSPPAEDQPDPAAAAVAAAVGDDSYPHPAAATDQHL
jgi:hypothetical protein